MKLCGYTLLSSFRCNLYRSLPSLLPSLELENIPFVWATFLELICAFSTTTKSEAHEVIVNTLKFLLPRYRINVLSDLISASVFVWFATVEFLIMYLAVPNLCISSGGRIPASLCAPNVFAYTGISRASLIALLSRLCNLFRLALRSGEVGLLPICQLRSYKRESQMNKSVYVLTPGILYDNFQ